MTSEISEYEHHPAKGIPFILVGTFCNASMVTCVKLLETAIPSRVVVLMRFLVTFMWILLALPIAKKNKTLKETLQIKAFFPFVIRFITNFLALSCYFYAIEKLSLSSAVVLFFTSPLFIPIITWIWKKIPLSVSNVSCTLIGLAGVICIVGLSFEKLQIGHVAGLLGAIFAAISFVAGRIQTKEDTVYRINFHIFLWTSVLSLLIAAKPLYEIIPILTYRDWTLFFLIGSFGCAFQFLLLTSLKYTHVRFIGSFLYFSVLYASIGDWVLFKTKPTLSHLAGIFLIISGGLLMTFFDSRKEKVN